MKHFFSFLLVCLTLASCNSNKEYNQNALGLFMRIKNVTGLCETEGNAVYKAWNRAVKQQGDDAAVPTSVHSGAYMKLLVQSDSLSLKLAELEDAPEDCRTTYKDLTELVQATTNFVRLTTKPQGTLQDFTRQVKAADDLVVEKLEAFKASHKEVFIIPEN